MSDRGWVGEGEEDEEGVEWSGGGLGGAELFELRKAGFAGGGGGLPLVEASDAAATCSNDELDTASTPFLLGSGGATAS